MRLILIIPSMRCGGAERKLSLMANYWAASGREVFLFTFDKTPPFYELSSSIHKEFLEISSPSIGFFHALQQTFTRCRILRKKIKETKPDVVLPFMDETGALILLAMLGLSIPVVVVNSTPFSSRNMHFLWFLICCLFFPFAAGIVVQTQKGFLSFPWYCRFKSCVIPNPVNEPAAVLKNNSKQEKIIMAVGRLKIEKGHDLLLRAFALIAPQHPDWSVTIWGDGPLKLSLEKMRDQLGLKDRVRFEGITKNIEQEFNKADIFVLPSRREGFPNVLCEAMAQGIPPISFDCPYGPRAIIRDGVDGILVPAQDFKALALAMESLIKSEEKRRQLSRNAVEVTQRFSLKKVMDKWDSFLQEVLGRYFHGWI